MFERSIILFAQIGKLLLAGTAWAWLELAIVPDWALLFYLLGSIAVNMLTGVLKAWSTGVTEPAWFRRTAVRLGIYFCLIAATWLSVSMVAKGYPGPRYAKLLNITITVLTGVEVYGVFKNVHEIMPDTPLSKFFVRPVLRFISIALSQFSKTLKTYEPDDKADAAGDPESGDATAH